MNAYESEHRHNPPNLRSTVLIAVSACIAGTGPPTFAAETGALEEIVVTATKREESAQKVPIPITAFSGEDLENLGARNSFDIASQTPALRVESASGRAEPRFNLRGLGTNEYTPNANSSVGVYVDEVYLNSTVAQGFGLFDLQRVEVLRGPQGTLWGKNTTAGAISFVSRAPTEELNGYAMINYGNYGQRDLEGAIGGSLVDNVLLGRVSVSYSSGDGYVRNTYLGTIDNNYAEGSGRAQLLWKIADDTSLLLSMHESHLSQTVPVFFKGYLPGNTDAIGGTVTPTSRYVVSENVRGTGDIDASGGFAKLQMPLPADWRLTNILAVETNKFAQLDDTDATPVPILSEAFTSSADQYSDEVRFTSPDTGRVSWIFGGYAMYEKLNVIYTLPDAFLGGPGSASSTNSHFVTRNYAGFGSSTLRFTDKLSGRLGLRYTREQKTADQLGVNYSPLASDPTRVNLSTTAPVPFGGLKDDRTWSSVTGDASLDYQVNERSMVYGRVAKGFRGGNYNAGILSPGDFGGVNPETLIDYEAGVKSGWADGRLQTNLAVFHYDYRDLQVLLLNDIGTRLNNAAKARVNGVELELSAAPTDQLMLRVAASYTDAKYQDYRNASVPGPLGGAGVDLSGQRLERAPRDTLSALLQYTIPIGQGKLVLQTDWRYTGKVTFAPWVDSPNLRPSPGIAPFVSTIFSETSQDPVTIGNVRIAYTVPGNRMEVALWAKNVTNQRYKTNMFNLLFDRMVGYYLNDPLTYGVNIKYSFEGK